MRESDFRVRVSRKDCAKGYHGWWKTELENDLIRGEVCEVCGKKVEYHKLAGKLDEIKWRINHKLDFLQPFYPDGMKCPEYWYYYGDPWEFSKIRKDED